MINFANEGLCKISCDKISTDSHEETNLISLDGKIREKGFLSGNFLKPPVTLRIDFLCPINIKEIIIDTKVGQQKSSGFEIFTQSDSRQEVSVVKSFEAKQRTVRFAIYGKGSNCVYFNNSKFLNKIKSISIKILKTENSTLPCLGSLRILGEIHRSVKDDIKNEALAIWKKITKPKEKVEKQQKIEEKTESNFEVPEEFLDCITWDLMTIPMVLPSGNIVDVTTLEKFYLAEEEHGRGKSDPFTGVMFTSDIQPVVAASLKGRIDQFLLKHDRPELNNVPRALGKKETEEIQNQPSSSSGKRTFEEMMKNCLSGLPSFLEKPQVKKVSNDCSSCGSDKILFILHCKHIVCRDCLKKLKMEKDPFCPFCWESVDFEKLSRHHVSTYFK